MTGLAPDEIIAIGAARQASYLPDSWDSNFEDMTVTVQAASKGIYFKVGLNFWLETNKAMFASLGTQWGMEDFDSCYIPNPIHEENEACCTCWMH
jgi:hypothetical protein